MVWAFVIGFGLLALVVSGVVSSLVAMLFAPHREANSPTQLAVLAGLSAAAFVGLIAVTAVAPDAAFVPVLGWLLALAVVRNSAPLKETDQQRREREAAERKQAEQELKRAAARKAVAERKRVDSLTKDGLALLDRARSAVAGVKATEAARDGWLGEPADLDFSRDIAMVSDALLQARRIEKMVESTKKIPDPGPDDIAMLRDAEKTVKTLRAQAKQRVKILDDCAAQAREVDRLLAQERRRQQIEEQRDDARRRLAAELYGAEIMPSQRESDAADAVAARVAAFRELKNIVDDTVRHDIEAGVDGGGANPVRNVLSRVRRALPF